MTPKLFLDRLGELIAQRDWQAVLDWHDAHYTGVEAELSEEDRDAVVRGAVRTADVILEGRRRRGVSEQAPERELTPAT